MTNLPSRQDIHTTTVTGLESASYIDKLLPAAQSSQSPASKPISISAETDRIYTAPLDQTISVLEDGEPRYEFTRDMMGDVVIWNPWEKKAAGMADFGPEGAWKNMICVEAGSVQEWNKLEAGDTWEGGVRVRAV